MTGPVEAAHKPVLLDEVVESLNLAPGRSVVDGTFGAGGYSRAFLDAGANVIAIDRDPSAARFAAPLKAEFPDRFQLVQGRFSDLEQHLNVCGLDACDGVALDLGVSSMQLDEADRGFSVMRDGPLDMRMSSSGRSAADLVNEDETAELARIFWAYGDERASRHIANVIVRRRAERPFTRTLDLAETVERALGGRRGAPTHPATGVRPWTAAARSGISRASARKGDLPGACYVLSATHPESGYRRRGLQEGLAIVQIFVRDNNVDQALKALKKKMQREGTFREMKRHVHYEKPSEKRARQKAEAVRRARKLARKRAQREGLIAAPKKPAAR